MASNIDLVQDFIRAWNDKELDRAANMLAEDVFYHNVPMDVIHGREAARSFFMSMANAEKIQWDLLNIAENGNVVMTERVDRFVMADGKEIAVPLMGIFEIEGGEIKVWKDYFDLATFQNQMV